MANIAFIGLGNMGRPMVANLVAAGHAVRAFDVAAEARQAAADAGAEAADSLDDVVEVAEAVVTMLPAGAHVREVYEGVAGEGGVFAHAPVGALCIDCSTIDVASSRAVAEIARQSGFPMVDAPVSGGVAAAQAGSLTFMVGGGTDAFKRGEPILQDMGKAVIHAGEAGAGQAAKICNNMLLGISMIGACEAFHLADKLGLDAQTFFDIVSKASGQCWSVTSYCPVPGPVPESPANRGYEPGFAAAMMLKDLRLAQDAALSVGAPTPMGAEAQSVYALFDALGGGGNDFSGVIEMLVGTYERAR